MYRHTVERSTDEAVAGSASLELGRLIANDNTLELAVHLLTPKAARKLEGRHKWKVHVFLLDEVRSPHDLRGEFPSALEADIHRLLPGMSKDGRAELVEAFEIALLDDDPWQAFRALALVNRCADQLPDEERQPLAGVIVNRAAAGDPNFSRFLEQSLQVLTPKLRADVEKAQNRDQLPGGIAEALGLEDEPTKPS
jgi:hypothetical protein